MTAGLRLGSLPSPADSPNRKIVVEIGNVTEIPNRVKDEERVQARGGATRRETARR
jgi:hypothetical protein